MEYFKLQFGCLLAVLYITLIYIRQEQRFRIHHQFSLYDALLIVGIFSLLLDGTTAWTVNHLDSVPAGWNLLLHGMFLASLDGVVFVMFLYILSATRGLPVSKAGWYLLCLPFLITVLAVFLSLSTLEYRAGTISNYSMGVPAYTCFFMVGLYSLLTLGLILRQWAHLPTQKRFTILSCLVVMLGVTVYQMLHPDALISSAGTMMLILGAYLNQEDPAFKELNRYHEEMVMGFSTLIENRDNSTGGHVKRTTFYVRLLAEELRQMEAFQDILTPDYMKDLLMAAPMHDIGKIAIPDAILQKPGRLTEEEFEIMKQHTVRGGAIIQDTFSRMGDPQYLDIAYQIARYHHEKWNGRGYPDGLAGEEIPLCARIIAIADVFDAVSESRCYRAALPLDQCFAIIRDGRGTDFDPQLTDVFLSLHDQVVAVHDSTA